MKVSLKLRLAFLVMAGFVSIVGVRGVKYSSAIRHDIDVIRLGKVEEVKHAAAAAFYLQRIQSGIRELLLESIKGRPEEISRARGMIETSMPELQNSTIHWETAVNTGLSLGQEGDRKELRNIQVIRSRLDNFLILTKNIIGLEQEKKFKVAEELFEDEVEPLIRQIQTQLKDSAIATNEEIDSALGRVRKAAGDTERYAVVITAAALLLAISLGYYVSKSITYPLGKLRDAAVEIGNGKLDSHVVEVTSNDEIGEVAISLRNMVEKLDKSMRKFNKELAVRRQTEESLRKSEERYRKLFEQSNDAIFIHTLDGEIIDVNGRACEMLGYEEQQLLKLTVPGLHSEESLPEAGEAVETTRREGCVRFESRFKRADGTAIYGEVSARVVDSEEGIVQGIVRDVTHRKDAENALRESEGKLNAMLDSLGDCVSMVDRDLCITWANKTAGEAFGYDLIGKKCYEAYHGRKQPCEPDPCVVLKAFQDGGIHEDEVEQTGGDGKARHFRRFAKVALRDKEGRPTAVMEIARDITERKHAEHEAEVHQRQLFQAAKMISLGTLVSGVAHEVNNPVSFLMLNAPILQKLWSSSVPILDEHCRNNGDFHVGELSYSQLRERVPVLLSDMVDGAKRIKRIVGDLKDFARQSPSDMNSLVDTNSVVRAAVRLASHTIKKSTNRFSEDYGSDLPRVKGNAQRIEQVVVNLLLNACQALPDKERSVNVSTLHHEPSASVVIKISDDGTGIPLELQGRITDPFFTTKRDSGGTGLGLAISDKIVHEHGGIMAFVSTPDQGTTVTVRLPVRPDRESGNGGQNERNN